MYICLCLGVTSGAVQQAIQDGANSTKKVAAACGAGSVCGRCRHTVRVMLDAAAPESGKRPVERIRRRWRAS
jgi:bacterioferritin-associated ferredoxin